MRITASIVTYNCEGEISDVLNSLRQANVANLKTIIVDNSSKDQTVQIIKENFPEVDLIESSVNLGFGRGHNLALKNVESDYHIFINPDITIHEGEIEKMISFMEENPDAVLLNPRVLNPDGSEQYLPKKRPTYKYLFGGRLEKKFAFARRWRAEYTMRDVVINDPIEIDCATGCFMFCRTSALKAVGGFDERYFLYFEDADLARKMQQIGKLMYVPSITVVHAWHRENGKIGKSFFYALQSMRKYFKKWKKTSKEPILVREKDQRQKNSFKC